MKKLPLLSSLLAAMLLAACGDSDNEDEATPEEPIQEQDDVKPPEDNLPDFIIEDEVGDSGVYLKTGSMVTEYFEPSSLWLHFLSVSQGYVETSISVWFEDLDNWDASNRRQDFIRDNSVIKNILNTMEIPHTMLGNVLATNMR